MAAIQRHIKILIQGTLKGEGIAVLLTSCLTALEAVWQLTILVFSFLFAKQTNPNNLL